MSEVRTDDKPRASQALEQRAEGLSLLRLSRVATGQGEDMLALTMRGAKEEDEVKKEDLLS